MTLLALASSGGLSLGVAAPANATVQLQRSFFQRVLNPQFTDLCAPGFEGNP